MFYVDMNVNISSTLNRSINDTLDDNDNAVLRQGDPLWMVLMDRSQLIMTIIGFMANIGTSITLIKNRQVRMPTISIIKLITYIFISELYSHYFSSFAKNINFSL